MKDHRVLTPGQETRAQNQLFRAIASLPDVSDLHNFFVDLCTPAELQAMTDRWAVARLLDSGLTYRDIHDRTGVSLTTIGRVARCVSFGAGGYATALEKRTDG
jgi:TrpR-related protein YerC/YecD